MSSVPSLYIEYADGASRPSQNIASATWVIFSFTNAFVGSGGLFQGPATNNVAEYEVVISLLTQAYALGIHCLMVQLDSQLVVSHLTTCYSVQNPTLFRKYLKVRLLEREFDVIFYEHVSREFNALVDSYANHVLDWHLSHL
jgi:ribonuclease HI